MKVLLLTFTLLFAAYAEDPTIAQYVTRAQTAKITIQQPTTGAKIVVYQYVKIECAAASTVTLSVEGTAASTTLATPTPLNVSPVAKAKAYTSSNVGSGTTIDTYAVPVTPPYVIDLSSFYMSPDGTAHNLTLATDTGTCLFSIKHYEYDRWDQRNQDKR